MKKTFLIALTLLTNFVFAQTQLSDYYDARSANRQQFSYNIVVKIHKTTGATEYDTRYTATLVQASPDSKGFYNAYGDNKYYSCSQLGDVCKPNNLHLISVRLSYTCNGQQKADVVIFRNLNDVEQINTVYGAGGKLCESLDFSMKVMGAVIEPIHLGQIMNKINQIGTTKTTQNNTNSNNQSTQTNSKDTQTNETKSYELKLSDIGIPENNSSTTSQFQKNYETGQQLGELTNIVIDIFSPSPEKLAREEESIKQKAKDKAYYDNQFGALFNKYINAANNGNENARIELIKLVIEFRYKGSTDFRTYLPNYKKWALEAVNNNNLVAMDIIGYESMNYLNQAKALNFGLTREEGITMLEKSATLGSAKAMFLLAKYYDWDKCADNIGGRDAVKALEWFNKAALNNYASAYTYLGTIYTYKRSDPNFGGCNVKYKIKKNEILAAEYFKKAKELKENSIEDE
jgi:TPR repeat protein